MRLLGIVFLLVTQLSAGSSRQAGHAAALVSPVLRPAIRPVLRPSAAAISPRRASRVVAADSGDLFEGVAGLAKRAGEAAVEAGSRSIRTRSGSPGEDDEMAKKG